MDEDRSNSPVYLGLLTMAAALGGLLFGYDTAVISGAVGSLKAHFELGSELTGWAASSALVGCIVGAMLGGPASDWMGRKRVLLACAFLFAGSGILSAIPETLPQFAWARFLGGLAIGSVSVVSPLYIAEVSPERIRGRLVSLYQLAIVLGIVLVFFVNWRIQRLGDVDWNVDHGWRWMMGSLTLPAVLFGLLLLPVPESPRWLMKCGRRSEAEDILVRIGGRAAATRELRQIEQSLLEEEGRFSELLTSRYRQALWIGVGLAVVCQFSGINAIMYYAPEIFKSVGASQDAAFRQTVVVGVVNVLFTFVAITMVDHLGRRFLLLVGSAIQVVALAGVGWMFHQHIGGPPLLAFLLLFIAAFAMAMGPVPWIVISEIFPTKIRGRAMSVAVFVLWTSCFIVSQTCPILLERIGYGNTFWLYGLCSFVGLIFVALFVPETKGRTLEEIEQQWRH